MKKTALIIAVGTLLVACAKEKEYKEVFRENTFSKDLLMASSKDSLNDPYVYVPSVENTPMNITASRPYWMGEQKLVTFRFTEKYLEVLQIPTDERFSDNLNNFSPVFKLDITHMDYKCAKDEYDKCSNKEEEDKEKSWQSKKYFKADFSKLTTLETNTLPEQLTNLFQKCFEDKGSEVKSFEMTKDSLNITVEKTMVSHINCADLESFDDLRNIAFKVNHKYSFVKLSKLATKGYEPVVYPFTDQNTFGFFTTDTIKLTADNQRTVDSKLTLMNRWDPKRKEIPYLLNDAFFEKGMEHVRVATEQAIQAVNDSLNIAGVDLKVTLADGRGKDIGDLRNNFLILVKDPQASGIIGYGPSVANPLTGEILKAHTVMYYGTIRKIVQYTYDELVEEERQRAQNAQTEAAASESQVVENGKIKAGIEAELTHKNSVSSKMRSKIKDLLSVKDQVVLRNAAPIQVSSEKLSPKMMQKLKSEVFSHTRMLPDLTLKTEIEKARLSEAEKIMHEEKKFHKHFYHESQFNWDSALRGAVETGKINLKNAKLWSQLADSEKNALIEKLIPEVWIPTLVHEIGHNLGLRHNFNGSEDKPNFYDEKEKIKYGLKTDREIPYSSIMDYNFSSLNELHIMGKYDTAALSFGYNRVVQMKDGNKVPLKTKTLDDMKKDGTLDDLHDYQFCTDEHVSVNPGCNRHDEGTTLSEMAKHYVRAYHRNYERKNKRNNRLNFSSFSDGDYYSSARYTFQGLRIFFEVYDRIKGMYTDITDEQWETIPFLKEIKSATKIAADFYLEVLKTPEVHCAVATKATGKLAAVVPLKTLSKDALTCFDEENVRLNDKYILAGETGKHINHARGEDLVGDLKADPTQISIRGIWADKVLAMDYLMKREMGISTFDGYRTSFFDHEEFQSDILDVVLGLMNDEIEADVTLVTAKGQKIPFQHTFSIGNGLNIDKSFSDPLNRHLGMTRASTDLREIIYPLVKKNLLKADDEVETMGLFNALSAINLGPITYIPSEIAIMADLKDSQGRTGSRFAATHSNILAKSILSRREIRLKLDNFDPKVISAVHKLRTDEKVPEEIPEAVKVLFEMELETLEAYLMGKFPEDTLIQKLLTIMSR